MDTNKQINYKNKLLNLNKIFTKFIGLALFVISFAVISNAATFNVTTIADDESDGCANNQCTLREAIIEANNSFGADTINFDSGLSGIIVLNGNHLFINSNITINGPGARVLSISGNNASRVFEVRVKI